MLKRQTSLRNKYDSIIDVLLRFIAVFTGYVPMEDANDALIEKTVQIDEADAAQRKLIKSFTIDKRNKKKKQAALAKAMAKKVSAFAFDSADTILLGRMKISLSRLLYSNSKAAQTYAQTIYDAAHDMAAADKTKYKISDPELAELNSAILSYSEAISAPRDQVVIRKAATDLLPSLFDDAENIVNDRLSNLMANYQVTNPDFYEQFNNALTEITFNRYTAIEGEVIDASTGEDLSNVQITLSSSEDTFEEMSNSDGNFVRRQLNPNIDWIVTFELPEYEKVTKKVKKIGRGKHAVVNVELKKSES